MIGHYHALPSGPTGDGSNATRQTAHMMGVDHVRAPQSPQQTWRQRVRWVAAQPAESAQRAHAQAARLVLDAGLAPEGNQLAVDVTRQCAGQLERVTLSATI
jgi:hypothetical protein